MTKRRRCTNNFRPVGRASDQCPTPSHHTMEAAPLAPPPRAHPEEREQALAAGPRGGGGGGGGGGKAL